MQSTTAADYAINHWHRHETDAEHAIRVENAEVEATALFNEATVHHRGLYSAKITVLTGLKGPRYDRKRAEALRQFQVDTAEARELFLLTCDALMRDGEIPEDIDIAWTRLIDPERAEKLWPVDEAIVRAA